MKQTLSEPTVTTVLQEIVRCGVKDFCICPGGRNAPFVAALKLEPQLACYYFYDERSAAFFALGRSQALNRPVAIITTSGTAPAHLLAAVMEAYYTGTPLVAISADRPRRFQNSNAPQTCEQNHLYGVYTKIFLDIAQEEPCDLTGWDRCSPVHINICLEEPSPALFPQTSELEITESPYTPSLQDPEPYHKELDLFLSNVKHPLVVVGKLQPRYREATAQFLLQLQAPVYLEAISGLREDSRLQPLAITRSSRLWDDSNNGGYPIDGILRIGGVPTFRLWRDLEYKQSQIKVFSVNDRPFSGLSWGPIVHYPMDVFFESYEVCQRFISPALEKWLSNEKIYQQNLLSLLAEEPHAEPSLIHALSAKIPKGSIVYLGNSLPIREWDLAATLENRHFNMHATRGLNGIDGQSSVFLGYSSPQQENWALLGDLTALHDLAAPWILPQLPSTVVNLTIVNNGGGKLFERMFPQKEIQNCHTTRFPSVASLWNLSYEEWNEIPSNISCNKNRLIEIIPDNQASQRFWDKLEKL